jgi:predicted nuclease of predicted toxin-antitoxin system
VRLFIDECLSPSLARRLNVTGEHEAIHPLDVGRRGEADYKVIERCLAEDRIIVSENARDFRRLLGKLELHPGLILLPAVDREATWELLLRVIAFLNARGDPAQLLVNHEVAIGLDGVITLSALPAGRK